MNRIRHRLFKLSYNKRVAQLPPQYLDYLEKVKAPPERVHDSPPDTKYLDYNQDHDTGYIYRVPDQRIHARVPPHVNTRGLWGGLEIVEGYEKPKRLKPRLTKVWWPSREIHTLYSEILDCHINIEITERTIQLMDEHQGFDNYILSTRPQDLKSAFGIRLQRKMLLALNNNPSDYIKQKYNAFIRPIEEVEWHGLEVHEAMSKARLMRVEESIEPPLKLTYGQQLIEQLEASKNATV